MMSRQKNMSMIDKSDLNTHIANDESSNELLI